MAQQPQVSSAIAAKTQSAFVVVSFESTATKATYLMLNSKSVTWRSKAVRKCAWRIILQAKAVVPRRVLCRAHCRTFLGIRDTARVLGISPTTVIEELKKAPHLQAVNEVVLAERAPYQIIVRLCREDDLEIEAEIDEMWSYVKSKQQQRWLWLAIDPVTQQVLAYVLASHEDEAFLELKA